MKPLKTVLALVLVLTAGGIPGGALAAIPAAGVTPSSLTFGAANPEPPYPAQTITFTNTGDASLVISNITDRQPLVWLGQRLCPDQ